MCSSDLLHCTLGYIFTGTPVWGCDLDIAFHIMRAATYLSIIALYDEIQACIVQEMIHGLFHGFLEFTEYEGVTGGRWGTGAAAASAPGAPSSPRSPRTSRTRTSSAPRTQ